MAISSSKDFIVFPNDNSGRLFIQEATFTASGTWTAPAGVTSAQIVLVGAGGGGGGGSQNVAGGGGAGGGGGLRAVCAGDGADDARGRARRHGARHLRRVDRDAEGQHAMVPEGPRRAVHGLGRLRRLAG